MFQLPLGYKIAAIAATALIVASMGIWGYNKVYQRGYNYHKLQTEAATAKVLLDHALKTKEAGEAHAKNQLVVNRLIGQLNRLRIQVPAASCASSTEAGSDGSAGAFSDKLQAALERLRERDGIDALRCDQLNIDAIESNK